MIRGCLEVPSFSLSADPASSPACVLAKFCGDMLMISVTANSSHSRRDAVARVITSVSKLRSTFLEPLSFRSWIGWSPVVGTLLGAYSPTFEWYAPAITVATALLRSPLMHDYFRNGDVYASDAAVCGFSDEDMSSIFAPRQVWVARGIGRVGGRKLLSPCAD